MVQPATELMEEIMGQPGAKRALIGRGERGRVDLFIYYPNKDKVYHIKVEEIGPMLKDDLYGCHITGFGDELCDADDTIEKIMKYGFDFRKREEITDRVEKTIEKARAEGAITIIRVINSGRLDSIGPHDMFYAGMHSDPRLVRMLRQGLPRSIDGRLSAELDNILLKRDLGTNRYIW